MLLTVWCDNMSAVKCTIMEGCHEMKTFDENSETIKINLEKRTKSGNKVHMAQIDGDFIK